MTILVDANVLDKQRRAAEWMGILWETDLGRVSYQIIEEYYITLQTDQGSDTMTIISPFDHAPEEDSSAGPPIRWSA